MKGIILAGGAGTRLHPLTLGVSKQLLPIYNKPMIYYPISVLLMAGIRDILIITTPEEQWAFQRLLSDGEQFGVKFTYAVQPKPNGLAEAFLIGKPFIGNEPVCLILGDNIFYGAGLPELLQEARSNLKGVHLFGHEVKNPERYGVAEMTPQGKVLSIEEKPKHPKSHIAVTGLYFYDNRVISIAEKLKPSRRGELEITDVNCAYLAEGDAVMSVLGRGYAWLDAGTYDSLMQANYFVQVVEERQGVLIGAPEEIAFQQGFINHDQLFKSAQKLGKSPYGSYLMDILKRESFQGAVC